MKIKEFISFITIQTIMVCLLTMNPLVTGFGVAEASEEVFSESARLGLERMYDLQGALKGHGAQGAFAELGPRVAEEGQEFIASLSGRDKKILETPQGARFLKEHSRLARVHALKSKLGSCVNTEDKRNRKLDTQIINVVEQTPYTGGCDFRLTSERNGMIINSNLNDFINDLGRAQKAMNFGASSDVKNTTALYGINKFQDALHMQSLKNSMASYLSNRYKYEPTFINPETGAISQTHKNETVNRLCKDEDGSNFCSSSQKTELKLFVADKAKEIAATQKKTSYAAARTALRTRFNDLNTKLSNININVDYGVINDTADLENPNTRGAWTAYQQSYVEALQSPDGLLMMTEVMKEKAGGFKTLEDDHEDTQSGFGENYQMTKHSPNSFSSNDLRKAKEEIDEKVISQAKQLNSLQKKKKDQQRKWRDEDYQTWGIGWDGNEIYDERVEDVARLVKTNPAAVGQILLNNPEYADIVCDAINNINKQDKADAKWDSVMMIGGLIVAGVMIVGGAILMATGLGAPLGAATIAGGMTVGGAATAAVLVVGGIEAAYWSKRTYDHYDEYRDLEMAIFSGNMDESEVSQVEAAYSSFKEARFNALLALPAVLLPGIGKLATLSKGSRFTTALKGMNAATKARFLNSYGRFYKMLGEYPKLRRALDAMIKSGRLPAEKVQDFFMMLSKGKQGLNNKFLTWMTGKLERFKNVDDPTAFQAFMNKFAGIVDEGLEAAQKACRI